MWLAAPFWSSHKNAYGNIHSWHINWTCSATTWHEVFPCQIGFNCLDMHLYCTSTVSSMEWNVVHPASVRFLWIMTDFPNFIIFSSHTCGNPILSWTKVIDKAKIWPSRFPCHCFFFLLPPPGMTPGSSSTTHCALRAARINYNLTNLSRCTPFLMVLFSFPFNAF